MQKSILIWSLHFFCFSASAQTPSTACGKDPALTQKKITHVLRSLACSQSKSIQNCEEVEGLFPQNAPAVAAGSLAMVGAVQRFRPENLAGCKFSLIKNYYREYPLLNWLTIEPALAANNPVCHLYSPEGVIDSTTRAAIAEADVQILRQTEEVAQQAKNIQSLKDAARNAEVAAQNMKATKLAYYATDPELKEINAQIEDRRAKLKENAAAREGLKPDSKDFARLKEESDLIMKDRNDLLRRLKERETKVGYPEEHRTRLQEASQAKAKADSEKIRIDKMLGKVEDQERLLESQRRRLAEIAEARAKYLKTLSIAGVPKPGRATVDTLKSIGAVSEAHAKGIQTIDYLLDVAERAELGAAQTAATSASAREASRLAMGRLGQKAAFRVGAKVIGGVLVAATGPIAMAADVSIELGLLGAPPSDGHCLDDNIEKLYMSHLTSFTQANKCKASPIIADLALFRKIFDLTSEEQLRLFNNSEFCNWLDSVYQAHAPKMKVTCLPSGATYQTPAGRTIQFSLNEDGSLKKFDSYGSENGPDDFMYSVNFENNTPKNLGLFTPSRQYLMQRSFDANAFKPEFQTKYDFNSTSDKVKMNDTQYTALRRAYRTNIIAITEIKSCCNPQNPAIEDSTCYSRYGIKSKQGTAPTQPITTNPSNRSI